MGITYGFCDCKNNDPRLEENLRLGYDNQNEQYKLKSYNNKKNFKNNRLDEQNSELFEIKRKNAVEKIIKAYKNYKINQGLGPETQQNKKNMDGNRSCIRGVLYWNSIELGDGEKDANSHVESNSISSDSTRFKHLKCFSEDEVVYIGEKKNGLKHGFGIKMWGDEAKYIGYYKNDRAEGFGRFIAKEDKYEGEFQNDGAYGFGIYNHDNETIYVGYWVDDSQERYGIEKWKDGSEYRGEFYNGKKHGIGTYFWIDGSKYEGNWYNNSLHGYGIYHFGNQRMYLGEWRNNMKEGFGIFIWPDKTFIGFYSNDKKEGFGIYFWSKVNKAFMGFWKEGKQKGFGKFMSKGKNKFGMWNDNVVEWFKNEEEAFDFLDIQCLKAYKHIFLFSLDDINNYCTDNEKWENLLT